MHPSKLLEWLNPKYLEPREIKKLQQQFLNAKPFPHLVLPHFFAYDTPAKLQKGLADEPFQLKDSDLFTFFQTKDLQSSDNPIFWTFREFLCSPEFIGYVSSLSGIALKPDIIDLAGTRYEDTHYLLCHDDQLESRAIAFFLYLSDLPAKAGGRLQLFGSQEGKPATIEKNIPPRFNTFAFFQVSPLSFHAVEEVINSKRLAISGWFHHAEKRQGERAQQ